MKNGKATAKPLLEKIESWEALINLSNYNIKSVNNWFKTNTQADSFEAVCFYKYIFSNESKAYEQYDWDLLWENPTLEPMSIKNIVTDSVLDRKYIFKTFPNIVSIIDRRLQEHLANILIPAAAQWKESIADLNYRYGKLLKEQFKK